MSSNVALSRDQSPSLERSRSMVSLALPDLPDLHTCVLRRILHERED